MIHCKDCKRPVVIARMYEIEPDYQDASGHYHHPYYEPQIWEPGGGVILALCNAGHKDVEIEVRCGPNGHVIEPAECSFCGHRLSIDDATWYPNRDDGGSVLCHDCYSDLYLYTCSRCDREYPGKEAYEVGALFIVPHDLGDMAPKGPGLYRIDSYPFYADDMLSQRLLFWAVTKIVGYPEADPLGVGDFCGEICRDCRSELLAEIEAGRETPWRKGYVCKRLQGGCDD